VGQVAEAVNCQPTTTHTAYFTSTLVAEVVNCQPTTTHTAYFTSTLV